MSQGELSALLGISVVLPFPFALALLMTGGAPRLRRMLAAFYALGAGGVNLVLLNGFLELGRETGWGSFRLTPFSFPLFLLLELITVAGVLYAGFRKGEPEGQGLLSASILAGAGLAALAMLSRGLIAQVGLWEGVTLAALVGLAARGGRDLGKRLAAFWPWLLADALFIAGAVLCGTALKETAVFIKPPITSGGEVQVVAIAALFLLSALVRLGVFPFHFWIRGLVGRADPAWSAFFLGAANFLLAGMRLVVVTVFLGRLVASDWSLAIIIVGLASIVAGPLIALRRADVCDYIAGMYTMQAGFLVTGLGLFSRAGLEGAMLCLLVAPLCLTASMMAAGTAVSLRGTGRLHGQSLSARLAPAAFIGLLLSGMSLAGLPPLDGFVGKAMVVLANFDMAGSWPFHALVAGLAMAATGVAAVALVRVLGGMFAPSGPEVPALGKQSWVEGLATLGLCGGSLLIGFFPRLLIGNFISPGSKLLFASGFTGPGVAFRGTGVVLEKGLGLYLGSGWTAVAAAFVLAAVAGAIVAYFASRAAHPSEGSEGRFRPFLAGAEGDYCHSRDFAVLQELKWRPARWRGR